MTQPRPLELRLQQSMRRLLAKLNSAIENYNLVVSVVEAFRDEIVSEMEHYASDRSDRWQKSERGQRHEAWKQEWEGLDDQDDASSSRCSAVRRRGGRWRRARSSRMSSSSAG